MNGHISSYVKLPEGNHLPNKHRKPMDRSDIKSWGIPTNPKHQADEFSFLPRKETRPVQVATDVKQGRKASEVLELIADLECIHHVLEMTYTYPLVMSK